MFLRMMSFAAAIMALGCSEENPTPIAPPDTTITTDGYDKTCAAATDCVLVFTGNVCGCACTQESIAATEGSRYSAAQEEKRMSCTDILACQPCPETQAAACTQGMCTVIAK